MSEYKKLTGNWSGNGIGNDGPKLSLVGILGDVQTVDDGRKLRSDVSKAATHQELLDPYEKAK